MVYQTLPEADAIALRVAIGFEIVKLFDLKLDKKMGWVTTSQGKKQMQGIGSVVIGILETQYKRITLG